MSFPGDSGGASMRTHNASASSSNTSPTIAPVEERTNRPMPSPPHRGPSVSRPSGRCGAIYRGSPRPLDFLNGCECVGHGIQGKFKEVETFGYAVGSFPRFLAGVIAQPIKATVSTTGELGFEPRQTAPEAVVLPLHYSPFRERDGSRASQVRQDHPGGLEP